MLHKWLSNRARIFSSETHTHKHTHTKQMYCYIQRKAVVVVAGERAVTQNQTCELSGGRVAVVLKSHQSAPFTHRRELNKWAADADRG